MLVSRSDVSLRDSIQRDSCVTGAYAIAASDDGIGRCSSRERTKRSLSAGTVTPGNTGFHTVPGTSLAVIATLRGPVRRSRYGAIEVRPHAAACSRSAGVIVTCISFSASAKVSGVTAGPDPAPGPNVGGAPGVDGACASRTGASS